MPSGSQRSSQEAAAHGRGNGGRGRRGGAGATAGGSRHSGGSSSQDSGAVVAAPRRFRRTSTTDYAAPSTPVKLEPLPTKEELALLPKEERARQKKELLQRIELLRQQKNKKLHEVETKKHKVQQMQSSMANSVDAIEKKEEQLTNTMLRKIEKLEKDKARLTQHLEQEEASKFKMEKRLRVMKQENVKLKEDLKTEERTILTKLMRPLEGLKQQRVELEKKLEEEVQQPHAQAPVLCKEVAKIKETGLLSSAMSDGGDTADGMGANSSLMLLGAPSESDVETPRQPVPGSGNPATAGGGSDSRPSSTPRHRSASTRSQTGLTGAKLLQHTKNSDRPYFTPVRSASRRSHGSSVVCESFEDEPRSPDIGMSTSVAAKFSASGSQRESTAAMNPTSSFTSEVTPQAGQRMESVRTFTPIQASTSAPVQYPFPLRYAGGADDASTSCCSSGRSTPAFTPIPMSMPRDKDSLVDDTSMLTALRREIKRLKQLQRRTQTRTAVNESKISQLQSRVAEARKAHEEEMGNLSNISQRLRRTSLEAHELGAHNEAALEWSTDRSLHGATSTRGSLASSSVAACPRPTTTTATSGGTDSGFPLVTTDSLTDESGATVLRPSGLLGTPPHFAAKAPVVDPSLSLSLGLNVGSREDLAGSSERETGSDVGIPSPSSGTHHQDPNRKIHE